MSRMHFDTEKDGDGPANSRPPPPQDRTTRFWVGIVIAVGLAVFAASKGLPVIYLVLLR